MVLSGADRTAWAGIFAGKRGGRLLPTAVQTALVQFFSQNDLGPSEYWPVDVSNDDWQDVWDEFAADAGLTKKFELGAVTRWVTGRSGDALVHWRETRDLRHGLCCTG